MIVHDILVTFPTFLQLSQLFQTFPGNFPGTFSQIYFPRKVSTLVKNENLQIGVQNFLFENFNIFLKFAAGKFPGTFANFPGSFPGSFPGIFPRENSRRNPK